MLMEFAGGTRLGGWRYANILASLMDWIMEMGMKINCIKHKEMYIGTNKKPDIRWNLII